MQLTVRGQNVHTFEFASFDQATIAELKVRIAEAELVAVEEQLLFTSGRPLSDDEALLSTCFEDGSSATVDMTVRVRGGKVHGSLARAGKVKGQTPKVEKQEKKKKKTGRAKRRIQYNRRFVNVVAGFGKRRGPNSNSTT